MPGTDSPCQGAEQEPPIKIAAEKAVRFRWQCGPSGEDEVASDDRGASGSCSTAELFVVACYADRDDKNREADKAKSELFEKRPDSRHPISPYRRTAFRANAGSVAGKIVEAFLASLRGESNWAYGPQHSGRHTEG